MPHSTADADKSASLSPQHSNPDDVFCQRIWDMDDRQLLALWKFVYLLWVHRVMPKEFPKLYPPSTLPAVIPSMAEGEAAR